MVKETGVTITLSKKKKRYKTFPNLLNTSVFVTAGVDYHSLPVQLTTYHQDIK